MFFMWLFPILIVVAVVYLVRDYRGGGFSLDRPASRETPLDIARKRFARGDITREEFDEIKQALEA